MSQDFRDSPPEEVIAEALRMNVELTGLLADLQTSLLEADELSHAQVDCRAAFDRCMDVAKHLAFLSHKLDRIKAVT